MSNIFSEHKMISEVLPPIFLLVAFILMALVWPQTKADSRVIDVQSRPMPSKNEPVVPVLVTGKNAQIPEELLTQLSVKK